MRWIDSSDKFKAGAWKSEFEKIDFVSEFKRIEEEACFVKGRPAQVEYRLSVLRAEWRSLLERQKIAKGSA